MGDAREGKDETQKPVLDTDTFLDLNFVPQWARRPPDPVHARRYREHHESNGRDAHRAHHRGSTKRDRARQDPRDRKDRRPPPRDRDSHFNNQRDARPPRDENRNVHNRERHGHHHDSRPASTTVILHARFLPERKAISELAKRVAATHKAYPLLDLAGMLLAREGLCYVRLELTDACPADVSLFQCQHCRTVARERAMLEEHIIQNHLEDFFVTETETLEPPTGVFTCVAFCGISNQLLGPPNHHSYQEAVKQMHAQQFSHIPLETYRQKIRISHEPDDVEHWKNASTTQTVYRMKTVPDGDKLSLREAQRFMQQEVVGKSIKSMRRVVLQEAEAHTIRDPVIRSTLHHAWQRELRFPIHTALALRAAFRNRHLHVFKAGAGKGMHFVTAVQPTPLNPDVAIPAIRDTLKYLKEHPGCTREEIIHDLLGDVSLDAPQAKERLQPISWLTERGHIIEFFNGRLAIPR